MRNCHLANRFELMHREVATGYALRDFTFAFLLFVTMEKVNFNIQFLVHLSTVAVSKISDRP